MRRANKLTARNVETAKPGRHGDGNGIYLVISKTCIREFIFRFNWKGRPTEAGIGGITQRSPKPARRRLIAENL